MEHEWESYLFKASEGLLTIKLNELPVWVFSEPVVCTPVSNPPALGVHGSSNVDSRTLQMEQAQYHKNTYARTCGTVLDSLWILDVPWKLECERDGVPNWYGSGAGPSAIRTRTLHGSRAPTSGNNGRWIEAEALMPVGLVDSDSNLPDENGNEVPSFHCQLFPLTV